MPNHWTGSRTPLPPRMVSFDELEQLITQAEAHALAHHSDKVIPPCAASTCRCVYHRPRSEREQRRLRRLQGDDVP